MKTYGKITEKRCQRIWDTAYAIGFMHFKMQFNDPRYNAANIAEAIKYADSTVDQLLKEEKKG